MRNFNFMSYPCFSTLMAFLLLTATPCRASDTEVSRNTLRGLSSMGVLVEPMDDDAKRIGLDTNTIQTDVELKLRLAGIKVLTVEERLITPGGPYLYVNINVIPANGLCINSTDVELNQSVLLDRDNAIRAYGATTWSTGSVGNSPQDSASSIRKVLSNKLDRFLNAYLAVNPKK